MSLHFFTPPSEDTKRLPAPVPFRGSCPPNATEDGGFAAAELKHFQEAQRRRASRVQIWEGHTWAGAEPMQDPLPGRGDPHPLLLAFCPPGGKTDCQRHTCECDKAAALCFRSAPFHRRLVGYPNVLCRGHTPPCQDLHQSCTSPSVS